MPAIDFPSSPSIGDIWPATGASRWRYGGSGIWRAVGATTGGGGAGTFGALVPGRTLNANGEIQANDYGKVISLNGYRLAPGSGDNELIGGVLAVQGPGTVGSSSTADIVLLAGESAMVHCLAIGNTRVLASHWLGSLNILRRTEAQGLPSTCAVDRMVLVGDAPGPYALYLCIVTSPLQYLRLSTSESGLGDDPDAMTFDDMAFVFDTSEIVYT